MTEPASNADLAFFKNSKMPFYPQDPLILRIIARLDTAEEERGALRQRVQQDEKAARITVETCQKQGIGLAKYLAYHHIGMLEKDLADLQHDAERAAKTMAGLATENEKLRKEWDEVS